jgi:DNA-binding MarR family transcriptional regulator
VGIEIRAGIHTGELDVRDDDVGGIAVHIAARIMAAAGRWWRPSTPAGPRRTPLAPGPPWSTRQSPWRMPLDYRSAMPGLDQRDYERLLAFRTGLRRFLYWSGQQAEAAGITPAQHQLLLAVRGHPDPRGPTIGEIAGYLLVRHHSAVELIDRAVTAGLVARQPDSEDARTVRIALTARGRQRLETLAASHLEELARLTNQMHTLWAGLDAET